MSNPYAPPDSRVEDPTPHEPAGWLRLWAAVIGCSVPALIVAWGVVPWIAFNVVPFDPRDRSTMTPFLATDLVLSTLCFFGFSLLSAVLSRQRPYLSALGVSVIGWAFYLYEVGGLQGMIESTYPSWYDFFPSHFASGVAAAVVAVRRGRR